MSVWWIIALEAALGVAVAVGDPATPLVLLLAVMLGGVVILRPDWGLMWVVATLPLNTVALPVKGLRMKLCQFLMLMVAASWLMRALAKQSRIHFPPVLVPFAGYVALACASMVGSPSWRAPALFLQLVFFWGVCFLMINAVEGEALTRRVWRVHLGTGVVMALYGLLQAISSRVGLGWFELYQEGRAQGFFPEPDWFGYYLLSVLFPLLAVLADAQSSRRRLWLGLATGTVLMALLMSQVRAAWLGLAVGCLIWSLLKGRLIAEALRKSAIPVTLSLMVLVVALIAVPDLATQIGTRFATFGDVHERANSYRLAMGDITMAYIWNRPLEGYGLGSWGPLIGMTGPNAVGTWNIWMTAWFDLGLLGPLLLTLFFGGALISVWQAHRQVQKAWQPLLVGHSMGLVGLLVCNFFSDGTYFDFFWAYIGLGVALVRLKADREVMPWTSRSSSSAGTPAISSGTAS